MPDTNGIVRLVARWGTLVQDGGVSLLVQERGSRIWQQKIIRQATSSRIDGGASRINIIESVANSISS